MLYVENIDENDVAKEVWIQGRRQPRGKSLDTSKWLI